MDMPLSFINSICSTMFNGVLVNSIMASNIGYKKRNPPGCASMRGVAGVVVLNSKRLMEGCQSF
jgi:hypothetical protein